MRRVVVLVVAVFFGGCSSSEKPVPRVRAPFEPVAAQSAATETSPVVDSAAQRERVRVLTLMVEKVRRVQALEREIADLDRGECVFYWDPQDRPVSKADELRESLATMNERETERIAGEIDELRDALTDPVAREAFLRDVVEPFARLRDR